MHAFSATTHVSTIYGRSYNNNNNNSDRERRCNAMIIVPVKEGENIERAIKKFKRKFDKTGVIKELRRRQQFEAPSQIKRVKMAHAKYVQQLHANDEI